MGTCSDPARGRAGEPPLEGSKPPPSLLPVFSQPTCSHLMSRAISGLRECKVTSRPRNPSPPPLKPQGAEPQNGQGSGVQHWGWSSSFLTSDRDMSFNFSVCVPVSGAFTTCELLLKT